MFCSYRYQNQNFSLVSHSCRSCSTCVAVVSFVQHSCCTCLALVLLVFGTRVVNQTRSNVAYNNEKKITTEEKQLIDPHRRHQEEYLHFQISTNKASGNEKEVSYLLTNIQLVSSKSNKTDNTSLVNQSGKSIKKQKENEKNLSNTLNKQRKEKDNQQNLEKPQITDRSGVWRKGTCATVGDSMLNGTDQRRISKRHTVKVRFFPGARIKDMYHLISIFENT